PRMPNGKVDRAALPAPADIRRPAHDGPPTPPHSATEQALATIWADVLGVEGVGADDDFFDLGGHSLLAVRVISRVRDGLGVELGLRTVFDHPTVARLAREVDEARGRRRPLRPPLVPAVRDEHAELPLSLAQEPLWFLDQLVPGSPSYNLPAAYRLNGPLDAEALQRALTEIVLRHEALRTSFPAPGGQPRQRVAALAPVGLPLEDLSHFGPSADPEARRRAGLEASRPFDLAAGPLLRARLLGVGKDEHVLLLTTHHIVADGWSASVLRRELSVLYGAFCCGQPSPLRPLPIQYADFSVWQRGWLQGDVLDADLDWWHTELAGAPPTLELPTDRPRPRLPSYRGAMETFRIPAGLAAGVRALGRSRRASVYMTLLAAFKVLLARTTNTEDIVVGASAAGRVEAVLEDLVGFFVNTLALRTDLCGDPSFIEVLDRVRRTVLDGFDHQEAPFDKVVARVAPRRDLSHNPLVQVAFEFEDHVPVPTELGRHVHVTDLGGYTGAAYGSADGGSVPARLDVELFVATAADGSLDATLVYATDLYEPGTMARVAAAYGAILETIVSDPTAKVSDMPLPRR
ncbi:MAG: condensation domain-containing protein, partial [Actinobacteria bacterium]|nr:condensation domain-containing protein [Actinomycetota bacterium]